MILLDEPTAGLSPAESTMMTATLKKLDPHITILIIEHDMDVAFQVADRITVLHQGCLFSEGTPAEIRSNSRVQEIYFGTEEKTVLKVEDIHTYYGDSYILQGISMQVKEGEVIGLLGRNGMGKTTLIRSIIGFTPPRRGRVIFKNMDVTHNRPFKIARLGISVVPQGRQIFPSLDVTENLTVGFSGKTDGWTLETDL